MSESKKGAGLTAGLIACVLAVIGIVFFGVIFVPLAVVVMLFGMTIAIKNKNIAGIGVNALAVVLSFIGLVTSPVLIGALGVSV